MARSPVLVLAPWIVTLSWGLAACSGSAESDKGNHPFDSGADVLSDAAGESGDAFSQSPDANSVEGGRFADARIVPSESGISMPDAPSAGICNGACSAKQFVDCTCAPSDPCGWKHDGVCQEGCYALKTTSLLDDSADCDLDSDMLMDFEELALANRFSPALIYSKIDTTTGKMPHFAVRPKGKNQASIFYALSYFEDGGDPETGVLDHLGDSEFIVVDVVKNVSGWSMTRAYLSAHYQAGITDASTWFARMEFNFDERNGEEHLLIWVAAGKHGNYPNQALCDQGGLGFDHCEADGVTEVYKFDASRNLGSDTKPLVNQVSRGGNSEFFWKDLRFCGWKVSSLADPDRGSCAPSANSYAKQLAAWKVDFVQ